VADGAQGASAAKALTGATPKIKGKARVGTKLKAVKGKWTAKSKISYRWYRDGKAIKGAKSATYKVKSADAGAKITVKVTAKKAGFTTLSKMSKAKKIAAAR
jgi:hypothetical protein